MQRSGFDLEKVTLKGLEVEAGREMGLSLGRCQLILTLITSRHQQQSVKRGEKLDFQVKRNVIP